MPHNVGVLSLYTPTCPFVAGLPFPTLVEIQKFRKIFAQILSIFYVLYALPGLHFGYALVALSGFKW